MEVVPIVCPHGTMPGLSDPLRIEPAKPGQRQKALQLLQLGPAHLERLLSAAFSGEVDMDGLFLARRGFSAALLGGNRRPVTSHSVGPPQITNDEPEQTAQMLQAAVDHFLDCVGTVLSQAILPPSDILHALRLSRAGYKHLADLAYLVSEQETFPTSEPTGELTFTTSPRDDDSRIRHVIEHSYIDTLDCPELERTRNLDDVLFGYRRTGVYRPHWWLIARHMEQDVGCVLVADHPEHQQCELMYMGIVPEARGHGLGGRVGATSPVDRPERQRERIVLAVDDGNWPASAASRHTASSSGTNEACTCAQHP